MIFTTVSWIGDHILTWPIASWYYKTYGEKIDWVCTKNYYMYPIIKSFLEEQEFTNSVTLVDVGSNAHDVNDWKFNPIKFGIDGTYVNFGFPYHPRNMYMPEYFAHNVDMGFDNEFIPTVNSYDINKFSKITIPVKHQSDRWKMWKSLMPDDVIELDVNDNFGTNVFLGKVADKRYLGGSSFSVIMDMLNLHCTVFIQPGLEVQSIYRNLYLHTYING